jgi:O-antigen/teichoic acid export membrane protein
VQDELSPSSAAGSGPGKRRRTLAGGSALVAVGLVLNGLGTVVVLALVARLLPATHAADFTVWWATATLLGTACGAFEAHLARLLITDLAAGEGHARATGALVGRTLLTVTSAGAVLVALSPLLASRLFSGALVPALLLPVFTALGAAQALQRGAATARHDFGAIARQLGSDGVFRATVVGLLVAAGVDSPSALAAACCVAAAMSVAFAGARRTSWWATPRLRAADVPVLPILYLFVGTVGPLLVNNGSVPWLRSTHSVDSATVVAFGAAVVLSRIPTQLVSAAFNPLLAHLSSAVEEGDEAGFGRVVRVAGVATAALGATYVVLFALVGPWALTVWLGPGYALRASYLAVLAAASAGMLVIVVFQAALGALDRWSRIAAGWGVGAVAFGLTLLLPVSTLSRATAAPMAAVLTAVAVMWWLGSGAWLERPRATKGGPGDGP